MISNIFSRSYTCATAPICSSASLFQCDQINKTHSYWQLFGKLEQQLKVEINIGQDIIYMRLVGWVIWSAVNVAILSRCLSVTYNMLQKWYIIETTNIEERRSNENVSLDIIIHLNIFYNIIMSQWEPDVHWTESFFIPRIFHIYVRRKSKILCKTHYYSKTIK